MVSSLHSNRTFFFLYAFLLMACSPPPVFKAMDITGVEWGNGDFELTAHTGKRVKASNFQDKVVVLFFGFTHCPDICSPTLAKLAQLQKRLGEDARHVQVLFITVDPERDTPRQLAGFIPQFNPAFIGLTGTDKEIAAVTSEFKVGFGRNPADKSLIDHSTGILVKDKRGRMRLLVKNDVTLDNLEHDVRALLKE